MEELARRYHEGQLRRGNGNIPYIVHPEKVVSTLLEWGELPKSNVISVAWGHDLLEDTTVSEKEILAVSNQEVLDCIKELTCPENGNKKQYLKFIADKGTRNALVIKLADRINNSKDFLELKGPLYALQYLHAADALIPALEKLSTDKVVENGLLEYKKLDDKLSSLAKKDAIRGSLLGGAVGDALGAPIEFYSYQQIINKYNGPVTNYVEFGNSKGSITDDTQMILFTIEGILRSNSRYKCKGVCDSVSMVNMSYQRWLVTQGYPTTVDKEIINSGWLINQKALFKVRAPGNTCLSALSRGMYKAINNSKGCGTVMRMAPVGLFFSPEIAFEQGCKYSNITHGHPTGIISGGALAMLISYLVKGKDLDDALDLVEKHLEKIEYSSETLLAIRKARTVNDITLLGEGWIAEEALAIGIHCALNNKWDFAKGVIEAINITGDSDSTGAIAGNILGALNGEDAIPLEWRTNLQEYNIVSIAANDLYVGFEEDENKGEYPNHIPSKNWWNKYPGF